LGLKAIHIPIFLFGILLIGIVGCATKPTQQRVIARQTRELPMPYDKAFDITKNAMFSEGYTITFSDREEGILSTQYTRKAAEGGFTLGFWAIVPMIFFEVEGDRVTHRASVLLKEIGTDRTRIRIVIESEGKDVTEDKLTDHIMEIIMKEAKLH
jgi:hypothetical protein